MIKIKNLSLVLLTFSLLQLSVPAATQEKSDEKLKEKADIGKKKIERPTKKIIEKAPPVKKEKKVTRADRSKIAIELTTKKILKKSPPSNKEKEREKQKLALKNIKRKPLSKEYQQHLKKTLERLYSQKREPNPVTQRKPIRTSNSHRSKVKPGDVRWHPSYEEALKASKKTGKPVLLFQLLGKLDEEFT